jgi:class 3 adenylate cyclase
VADVPETRYARSGDVHVAYQETGSGDLDLVFVPGFASHVEFQWEEPHQARFLRRLGSFSRLIRFDKRGEGLSDRVVSMPTLEERMDDVRAVMDAVDSERAALLGLSEGGPLSMLFAATYPERTVALVLWNAFVRLTQAPGYPFGFAPEVFDQLLESYDELWGTGVFVSTFVPSVAQDQSFRTWWTRFERTAMSPGAALESMRMNRDIDVRDVLPLVRTPTLIIFSTDDNLAGGSRYLADHLPDAIVRERPGPDHFAWLDLGVVDAIEEFLTGTRAAAGADRVFATVLFTDIVGSTLRAAEVGDRQWGELLDAHNDVVSRQLRLFDGQLVKTTGDGCLSTFDGPRRAVRCAAAMRDSLRSLGIDIRAGIHAGEVERRGADVGGIGVNIASRVASLAGAEEVLASRTVVDLLIGSGIEFRDRGEHQLKGVPGTWRLFAVEA